MIARQDYAGRRVLVLGLTEHGLAAARALKAGGARVELVDRIAEAERGHRVSCLV